MNIYIGNMAYTSTEDELRELFEAHGTVTSVRIITDRETGRPRGFGFVEMEDADEARKAIEELNQQDLGGRALVVNEARPKRERGSRGGGGYDGGGGGGGNW